MRANVRRVTSFISGLRNFDKAREQLLQFDKARAISKKSLREAQRAGLPWRQIGSDAGRRAPYYSDLHAAFLGFAGAPRGKSVLHLAASTGVYARFLQEHGAKAVALDLSREMLKIAKKLGNKRIVRANVRTARGRFYLPFANNSFDVFVSDRFLFSNYSEFERGKKDPLGRVRSRRQSLESLEELRRILRPGGVGLIYNT